MRTRIPAFRATSMARCAPLSGAMRPRNTTYSPSASPVPSPNGKADASSPWWITRAMGTVGGVAALGVGDGDDGDPGAEDAVQVGELLVEGAVDRGDHRQPGDSARRRRGPSPCGRGRRRGRPRPRRRGSRGAARGRPCRCACPRRASRAHLGRTGQVESPVAKRVTSWPAATRPAGHLVDDQLDPAVQTEAGWASTAGRSVRSA